MSDQPVPALVTLHVWRVSSRAVPAALARMALDRRHLHRTDGLTFAKSLGTGDGRTFTVRDAQPRRWALLACWSAAAAADAAEEGPVHQAWGRLAQERLRVDMRPVAARGRWSGRQPFGTPAPTRADDGGPVAALTRARLAPTRAATFWRAVPPVSADLHRSPGLLLAVGVGEAPVGLQGTFSIWRSAEDLSEFAYRGAAHRDVIARTPTQRWYREELFARFAVLRVSGSIGGHPIQVPLPLAG